MSTYVLFLYCAASSLAASYPALRLDDAGGGVAFDAAGSGHHTGVYVNQPQRGAPGAIAADADPAVAFDGQGAYVRIPRTGTDIAAFGSMLGSFTIEFWYRGDAGNEQKVLMGSVNDGPNTAMQIERGPAGRFNLLLRSDGGPQHLMRIFMSPERSATMADGDFHHVTWAVRDAAKGQVRVYLDGTEDTGVAVDGLSWGKFSPLQYDLAIGAAQVRGAVVQHVNAVLDEVALYPHPLEPGRVQTHYEAGIGETPGRYAKEVLGDAPFAYWRLGESSPRDLHLLLDDGVVARIENAVLRVGRAAKHPANPLFGQEHPWEVMYNNLYPNVLYDREEQLYKIWHTMFTVDSAYASTTPEERTPGTYMERARVRRDGLGYAVSKDGIQWQKPMMDIHPWEGQPSNLVSEHVHGVGILKDLRERDPARRYKMFFKGRSMCVRFSADGLRWGQYIACPEIAAAGDAHNNALWVPALERYVGFTRQWNDQRRVVARTESPDFVHWTQAVEVFRGKHLFDVYSMPVFRYGGVYLGLPAIFDEQADRVWTELAWSPDTVHWHRVDEGNPLIPNSDVKGDYDWGTVYASFPILEDGEIRLYYGSGNGGHFDWRDGFLCLATLRPDGFAGYEPEDAARPAVVVTTPVVLGQRLRITADAEGGAVTVAVLGESGEVLLTGEPLTGNMTDAPVTWKEGRIRAREFAGETVQLRFQLRNAKLYSYLL